MGFLISHPGLLAATLTAPGGEVPREQGQRMEEEEEVHPGNQWIFMGMKSCQGVGDLAVQDRLCMGLSS